MAAEAIMQVRQAEDRGREQVREAGQKAQKILAEARAECAEQRQSTVEQALKAKAERVAAACAQAQTRCDEIAAQGDIQRERILSPDPAKLEQAIKLVMERIVSV